MNNNANVIISTEDNNVIVLEVIVNSSLESINERKRFYEKTYEDVGVYTGINIIDLNKESENKYFRKLEILLKKKLNISSSITREDGLIVAEIHLNNIDEKMYKDILFLAFSVLPREYINDLAIIDRR